MTVRPSDPKSLAPTAASAVGGARAEGSARASSSATAAAAAAAGQGEDQVDLSAEARAEAARAQSRADSPEVESARVALRAGGGLSAERVHELRQRVTSGHYDQPEVVERVARAAARDLRPPSDG